MTCSPPAVPRRPARAREPRCAIVHLVLPNRRWLHDDMLTITPGAAPPRACQSPGAAAMQPRIPGLEVHSRIGSLQTHRCRSVTAIQRQSWRHCQLHCDNSDRLRKRCWLYRLSNSAMMSWLSVHVAMGTISRTQPRAPQALLFKEDVAPSSLVTCLIVHRIVVGILLRICPWMSSRATQCTPFLEANHRTIWASDS